MRAVLYLHNVPTVNGYPEREQDCEGCKFSQRPQQRYDELHICEKQFPSACIVSSTAVGEPTRRRLVTVSEVDYYLQMSEDYIRVHCSTCDKTLCRPAFPEHECIELMDHDHKWLEPTAEFVQFM